MTDHPTDEQLAAWLAADLDLPSAARIDEQLAADEDLALRADRLAEVSARLAAAHPEAAAPQGLAARIDAAVRAAAASPGEKTAAIGVVGSAAATPPGRRRPPRAGRGAGRAGRVVSALAAVFVLLAGAAVVLSGEWLDRMPPEGVDEAGESTPQLAQEATGEDDAVTAPPLPGEPSPVPVGTAPATAGAEVSPGTEEVTGDTGGAAADVGTAGGDSSTAGGAPGGATGGGGTGAGDGEVGPPTAATTPADDRPTPTPAPEEPPPPPPPAADEEGGFGGGVGGGPDEEPPPDDPAPAPSPAADPQQPPAAPVQPAGDGSEDADAGDQSSAPLIVDSGVELSDDQAVRQHFSGRPEAEALLGLDEEEARERSAAHAQAVRDAQSFSDGSPPASCLDAALGGSGTAVIARVESVVYDGTPAIAYLLVRGGPPLDRIDVEIRLPDGCHLLTAAAL